MTIPEVASIAFGAVGIGSGIASLYIRSTIADTILSKLDGRYVGALPCNERHTSLERQLMKMEHQTEKLEQRVIDGFDAIRSQLLSTQLAKAVFEKERIPRDREQED